MTRYVFLRHFVNKLESEKRQGIATKRLFCGACHVTFLGGLVYFKTLNQYVPKHSGFKEFVYMKYMMLLTY